MARPGEDDGGAGGEWPDAAGGEGGRAEPGAAAGSALFRTVRGGEAGRAVQDQNQAWPRRPGREIQRCVGRDFDLEFGCRGLVAAVAGRGTVREDRQGGGGGEVDCFEEGGMVNGLGGQAGSDDVVRAGHAFNALSVQIGMGGVGWYVQGFAGLEKQVMKKVCEEGAAVMRVLAHQVGAEDVRRSRRRGGFDFAGQVVEQGDTRELLSNPIHEYTRGLLGAVLSIEQGGGRLHQVPGVVPSPREFVDGDRFAPRSSHPTVGLDEKPTLRAVPGTDHLCARTDALEELLKEGAR